MGQTPGQALHTQPQLPAFSHQPACLSLWRVPVLVTDVSVTCYQVATSTRRSQAFHTHCCSGSTVWLPGEKPRTQKSKSFQVGRTAGRLSLQGQPQGCVNPSPGQSALSAIRSSLLLSGAADKAQAPTRSLAWLSLRPETGLGTDKAVRICRVCE